MLLGWLEVDKAATSAWHRHGSAYTSTYHFSLFLSIFTMLATYPLPVRMPRTCLWSFKYSKSGDGPVGYVYLFTSPLSFKTHLLHEMKMEVGNKRMEKKRKPRTMISGMGIKKKPNFWFLNLPLYLTLFQLLAKCPSCTNSSLNTEAIKTYCTETEGKNAKSPTTWSSN